MHFRSWRRQGLRRVSFINSHREVNFHVNIYAFNLFRKSIKIYYFIFVNAWLSVGKRSEQKIVWEQKAISCLDEIIVSTNILQKIFRWWCKYLLCRLGNLNRSRSSTDHLNEDGLEKQLAVFEIGLKVFFCFTWNIT